MVLSDHLQFKLYKCAILTNREVQMTVYLPSRYQSRHTTTLPAEPPPLAYVMYSSVLICSDSMNTNTPTGTGQEYHRDQNYPLTTTQNALSATYSVADLVFPKGGF